MGTNTLTINFGAFPGANEASVVVPEPGIGAASYIEPFVMASDSTSDHNANNHKYLPMLAEFTGGDPVAGVQYTVYGRSPHKLQGTFQLRAAWT